LSNPAVYKAMNYKANPRNLLDGSSWVREIFMDGQEDEGWVLSQTDVTPAILSRDFVAKLYCKTKSQVWHGVSCNFSTVAQFLFVLEQRSILSNFIAQMRWTVIGQFLFMRQSCSVRDGMSHLRFCRAIKLQVWHRS